MNTRSKKQLLLAAAVVIMLNFNSCSKYDDGPAFSLKSKTNRLVGEWEIVRMDNEKPDGEIIMEFEDNNDFSFNMSYTYYGQTYTYKINGEWEWANDKESIELNIDTETEEWDINRLTNDEFWFEDQDNTEYEAEKQ